MVTGLIFGGMLAGIGRDLLEEGIDPYGSWGFCIVEEGNDVLCFVLNERQNVSILFLENGGVKKLIIVFVLTKRNIMMISLLN